MKILEAVYGAITAFTNWLWGIPMLILLVGGGIILSVLIGGIQFRRLGFVFKNTIGTLFDKEEQQRKKAMGISPFQAVTVALGATIGTGNIVGVGVAIALGGPGALFWMWVCGFIAMGIKYSEVTLSCKYRQRNENGGGFLAGPYMYIKDGLHSRPLAALYGVLLLVTICVIGGVHASAVANSMSSIGVSNTVTCIGIVAIMAVVILGGLKRLVQVTDKMVPFMSALYILAALVVIVLNIGKTGAVFVSIFKGAFMGQAAIGGFAGAALTGTIRWGLARGVFSNDAGLGLQSIMHAQAEGIDHPAQQGMWGIFEVFFDTIVICSLTGFMIIYSGVWQTGEGGGTLAASAMSGAMGAVGKYGCVICLALFALSSLIAISEAVRIQSLAMFKSVTFSRVMLAIFLALIIGGCMANIESVFVFADFANGLILFLNIPVLILLHRPLRAATREWFDNNGDLDAIHRLNKK